MLFLATIEVSPSGDLGTGVPDMAGLPIPVGLRDTVIRGTDIGDLGSGGKRFGTEVAIRK